MCFPFTNLQKNILYKLKLINYKFINKIFFNKIQKL